MELKVIVGFDIMYRIIELNWQHLQAFHAFKDSYDDAAHILHVDAFFFICVLKSFLLLTLNLSYFHLPRTNFRFLPFFPPSLSLLLFLLSSLNFCFCLFSFFPFLYSLLDIETKQYQLDDNRKYKPDDEPVKRNLVSREFLGYIPVMLRSNCCRLKGRTDRDLTKVGECVFDQGGYFIINGSEKVRSYRMYVLSNTDVQFNFSFTALCHVLFLILFIFTHFLSSVLITQLYCFLETNTLLFYFTLLLGDDRPGEDVQQSCLRL